MANIQITPGETGKLPYHSPVGTTGLYIQAKLYNGSTLLTTLDLTEVGGGYYTVNYTPNGTVKYIFVQLIPYTDSGHTTKAEGNSEASIDIYVEYPYRLQSGSFGGVNIDYKVLAKEIWNYELEEDEIAKDVLLKKSEFNPKIDLVKTDLKIEKPVFNTRILQDLITEKINNLENKISNIKLLESERKVNLNPVLNEIKKINTGKNEIIVLMKLIKNIYEVVNSLPKNLTIESQIVDKKIKEELSNFKNAIQDNENMLEKLNELDEKRINKILKVLENLSYLISINNLKNNNSDD